MNLKVKLLKGISAFTKQLKAIRHFRNGRRTGDEMFPASVSGIVNGEAQVSYWPIFSLTLATVPEAFAKVNSAQFSFLIKLHVKLD